MTVHWLAAEKDHMIFFPIITGERLPNKARSASYKNLFVFHIVELWDDENQEPRCQEPKKFQILNLNGHRNLDSILMYRFWFHFLSSFSSLGILSLVLGIFGSLVLYSDLWDEQIANKQTHACCVYEHQRQLFWNFFNKLHAPEILFPDHKCHYTQVREHQPTRKSNKVI